jgi:hypothetical protein
MNQLLLDRVEIDAGDTALRFAQDTVDADTREPVLQEWIVATIEYSLGAPLPAAASAAILLGLA